jgi:hypothetical protein
MSVTQVPNDPSHRKEEASQDCGQSIDATSARTKAGQDRQREQAAESGAPNEDDHKNTVCG